jgi:hypothetical protein
VIQRDVILKHFFRHDKERGVRQAFAYLKDLDDTARTPPWWPATWFPVSQTLSASVFSRHLLPNATIIASSGSDSTMSMEWERALNVLLRYKLVAGNPMGCTEDHASTRYDEKSNQMICVCQPGYACATSDEPSSAPFTWGIVLASVGIALILIIVITTAVMTAQARQTLTLLATQRE